MKILIVNKYIYKNGGVEEYIRQIASVQYKDAEISILACNSKEDKSFENLQARVVLAKTNFKFASTPFSRDFWKKFLNEIKQSDIIHFHTPYPFAEFLAYFYRRKLLGKKIIVTYHAPVIGKKLLMLIYKPFRNYLLNRADVLVVTSEKMQKHDTVKNFKNKSIIIPCTSKDIGIGKNHDFSYIFSLGRLVKYKGFEYLIKAIINTPYKLIIAGTGPLFPKLKKIIKDSRADERIILVGEVDDSRLTSLYKEASIFVLPSISQSEAFGIVQCEAMSAGLPIINTNLDTGVPWVARDGVEAITVRPKNSKDIRDAIVKLIVNENERILLGKNGRLRYEELFTIEKLQKSHGVLYQKLNQSNIKLI